MEYNSGSNQASNLKLRARYNNRKFLLFILQLRNRIEFLQFIDYLLHGWSRPRLSLQASPHQARKHTVRYKHHLFVTPSRIWKLSDAHFAKRSTKAVDINLTTIKHNLRKSILLKKIHFIWVSRCLAPKYLFGTLFSVILRPWILVRPRESNPRPFALQSSAPPTELILPRLVNIQRGLVFITASQT